MVCHILRLWKVVSLTTAYVSKRGRMKLFYSKKLRYDKQFASCFEALKIICVGFPSQNQIQQPSCNFSSEVKYFNTKVLDNTDRCPFLTSIKILFKVIHLDTFPLTTTTHAKIERKGSSSCWWFCFNDIFSKYETSYNLCWQLLLWVLPETRHALKPVSHKYEYSFMF